MARKEKEKNMTLALFLPTLLVVVLGAALAAVLLVAARRSPKEAAGGRSPETEAWEEGREALQGKRAEKWQEGTISYQGKSYRYNPRIRTYLLMGIDKEGTPKETEENTDGGQSDAMFLVVLDAGKKELSVISINRNTMTRISAIDRYGVKQGEVTAQICTQHGFGDGMHLSCAKAAEAIQSETEGATVSVPNMEDAEVAAKVNEAITKAAEVDEKAEVKAVIELN